MTLILPMTCPRCDRPIDVRSDGGMPRCPSCGGKLKPCGPVRQAESLEDGEGPPKASSPEDDAALYCYGWGAD